MTRGTVLSLWIGLSMMSVAASGVTVLAPARALAAVDSREMQAREAFGAGRYQEALDLFVKLYAEKLHPNYLRNIGRCYQNLGDPDKAISSFREYLRKAKGLRADERAEVEGYIREMEDLKKQRTATATPPPPANPPPPRTIEPEPTATVVTPGATTTPGSSSITTAHDPAGTTSPGLTLTQPPQDAGPAAEPSSPVYKKWWFWTLIGVVAVGAGVGVAAAAGAFTKTENASCPAGVTCGGG